MGLYDLKAFNASLAPKPYCSNDLSNGLKIRAREHAIMHRYIQVNDRYIKFLVVDCDHSNPYIWEDVGLPAPNFMVTDRNKKTSHLIWALKMPIYKDHINKAKNLNLFAKIQFAYTDKCKGDKNYVGLIAKNPNNDFWQTLNINYFHSYELNELADYVELPKKITKKEAMGEGRNCLLFDTVRKFAYKQVLFYKEHADFQTFFNVVLDKLQKSNVFENSVGVSYKELWHIAKSISKWTWRNFTTEKYQQIFSKIQSNRNKKRKVVKDKIKRINSYEFS